ncbi:MAG TPA: hypothetical protein VET88_07670 [Gammaproteobacteria bacterium]|nr:hypothetical protein [Gammaproteobacteria bacterium]
MAAYAVLRLQVQQTGGDDSANAVTRGTILIATILPLAHGKAGTPSS